MTKNKKYAIEEVKITGSNQRAWELLMRISKKASFQNDIEKIRKDFGITNKKSDLQPKEVVFERFALPETWKKDNDQKTFKALHEKVEKLINNHKADILTAYPMIFYWIIFYKIYVLPCEIGTVALRDMVQIKKEVRTRNFQENYLYPVALLISPNASGEEIKEFIDAHSHKIQMLQRRYKDRSPANKRIRIREPLNITKLIYRLDGKKTNKEIASIANKKLGLEKHGYNNDDISRILDKKRRKEK